MWDGEVELLQVVLQPQTATLVHTSKMLNHPGGEPERVANCIWNAHIDIIAQPDYYGYNSMG